MSRFASNDFAIRVLVPEDVKRLKITPTPVEPAIPLSVGTYWGCDSLQPNPFSSESFNVCRLKIVVRDDDAEEVSCVQIN